MLSFYQLDPQTYDDQFWWKKDDIEFWKSVLLEDSKKTILELGAGTGRLAGPLVTAGNHYMGLDISKEYVEYAQQKFSKIKNIEFIQADMIDFNLKKTFDLIFIGFNSFLHLLKDDDATSCFKCVKKHMHKNTRFLIDIFIPNPLFLYRPEEIRFHVLEFNDSISGDKMYVEESNKYDADTEINKLTWYFSFDDQKDFAIEQFSMRMYFPSKMNQILIDNGFRILHQWGDYYRTPLGDGSKLQIYDVCLA